MKIIKVFLFMACLVLGIGAVNATGPRVNLTPVPMEMTVSQGDYTLPSGFKVGTAGLPEQMLTEVNRFVADINKATGLGASTDNAGQISVKFNSTLPEDGYKLSVDANGVKVEASAPVGLFYAFQSIKKILPANVMAGVPGDGKATYALPYVEIVDQPRFAYRGFMLDVSRHFFDVAQVKKMLDLMAMYKMNRFHWHLTDDQGWRLPVAKYPKLTTEGATNYGILRTDYSTGEQWREDENTPYGPYAYTAEDIKDVVAYAKNLHIEVIPEIDMPGHMVAAIHAYPEFSTRPKSTTGDYSHKIWNVGGVSKDVLDISNPAVMQFVKDVVDELAELFPYEYIHLGGDECPTEAWTNSRNCQMLKDELGLTSDRALQTWFTKQIADYALEKHGRKIMAWNELITSGGADVDMINSIKPSIFCWYPADNAATRAEELGLDHIYTPFNGGYYINRCYRGFDKKGAVGDGALSTAYTVLPPSNNKCIGVQGTFWTEQVDRPTDVEYLALPRLQALSEQGWSPDSKKNYDDFMLRLCADTVLLNLAGYNYGRHQLVDVSTLRTPDANKWYRIKTTSTDDRSGRVWELLSEDSPLVTQYADKNAKANRLWSNTVKTNNDFQLFRFVENPDNPGHYAIICKGVEDGSLSPTPTAVSTAGRWDYSDKVCYDFELDRSHYNYASDNIQYAIRVYGQSNQYMNFSKSAQGYAINVYGNPADGNSGILEFIEAGNVENPNTPTPPAPPVGEVTPAPGVFYRLLTRFNGDSAQPRYGSCIELLRDDAGKGNNAQQDRLWSNQPAEEGDDNYDYQWFTFEEDPDNEGFYAIVCKAKPLGSVNSEPSIRNDHNSGRWDYDNDNKHYGFYLVESVNGNPTQGYDEAGFYSALTSVDAAEGWYMNTSAAGQGYSVHLYNNPLDQNAGIYTFEPASTGVSIVADDNDNNRSGIYDLQGRRLNNIQSPGFYIVNGKKIMVK